MKDFFSEDALKDLFADSGFETKKFEVNTELSEEVFDSLRVYIHKACGIDLKPEKKYLIKQRLEPVLRQQKISSFTELAQKLNVYHPDELRDDVIMAMTTNETSFFRDKKPFEAFKNTILPELEDIIKERKNRPYNRKGPKVNIWCAATSTGQEPYSIAMLIDEYISKKIGSPISLDDFGITATDIDSNALAKAMSGEYTNLEVARGLPLEFQTKYFKKNDISNTWSLDNKIKNLVDFKRLNLIENFNNLGGFDVIFCRNVLIYFDINQKRKILDSFYNILSNDGILILGGSESMYELSDKFRSEHIHGAIIHKKKI